MYGQPSTDGENSSLDFAKSDTKNQQPVNQESIFRRILNLFNGRNGPNDNSKNESLRDQQETAKNVPCKIHINKTTEIISPDGTRQTRTKEFHKLSKGESSERREWEEKEEISASITRPDGSREVQLHEKYQDHTMELPSETHSHVYDEDLTA